MSKASRRRFLHSGIMVFGASATAGASCSSPQGLAEEAGNGDSAVTEQQSENGIIYHGGPTDLMKGFPPPRDKRVTLENYLDSEETLRWACQNSHRFLLHSIQIDRGRESVWVLPRADADVAQVNGMQVKLEDDSVSVEQWLTGHGTNAFLALHNGRIVTEQYFGEMRPETAHLTMSLTKSVTATAVANLLAQGLLQREVPVKHYVPELDRTAFRQTTIGNLLDQETAVEFSFGPPMEVLHAEGFPDDYRMGTDAFRRASHAWARFQRLSGFIPKVESDREHGGLYDLVLEPSEPVRPDGMYLHYAEPNPLVLQLAASRVTGKSVFQLWSDDLFGKLGLEHGPYLAHDGMGAVPTGAGLFITARDLARWGQMLLNHGVAAGRQVIPRDFIDDVLRMGPTKVIAKESNIYQMFPLETGYRSYFYVYPNGRAGLPIVLAAGAWGQWCLIDFARQNVVVKFSSELDLKKQQWLDFMGLCSFSESLFRLL